MSSVVILLRFTIDPHFIHNLAAIAILLMIRKVIKQPQSAGCLVSWLRASCAGVSSYVDMVRVQLQSQIAATFVLIGNLETPLYKKGT